MKNFIILLSLFCISLSAKATCSYGTGGGSITVTFDKVFASTEVPVGTILATVRNGNVIPKSFSCGAGDLYSINTNSSAIATGIKGIRGMPVYETGIPGIGFQISDITKGSAGQPIPAVLNEPVSAKSAQFDPNDAPKQVMIWLVKTGPITQQSLSNLVSVYFLAGTTTQTSGTGTSGSRLFTINLNMSRLKFKDASCDVVPVGGNTVTLPTVEASALNALSARAAGRSKDFKVDIVCPQSETGLKYRYWFNPISETYSSADGVLLNSSTNGAQNVGIQIKHKSSAIKFYDITSNAYVISQTVNTQTLEFTADYYKTGAQVTTPVTVGDTGEVSGRFEIVLQEE